MYGHRSSVGDSDAAESFFAVPRYDPPAAEQCHVEHPSLKRERERERRFVNAKCFVVRGSGRFSRNPSLASADQADNAVVVDQYSRLA